MNCKFDVFVMRGRRNNGGSARNTFGRRCEVQGSSSDAVDWTWLFRAYIGQPPPWRIGRPQDSAWTQEVHGALAKSIFARYNVYTHAGEKEMRSFVTARNAHVQKCKLPSGELLVSGRPRHGCRWYRNGVTELLYFIIRFFGPSDDEFPGDKEDRDIRELRPNRTEEGSPRRTVPREPKRRRSRNSLKKETIRLTMNIIHREEESA
ncbi:uncharacterized protein LOC125500067 isoform X1 [Athalia rosae]|uniref:uncharacterized protein LOC125500067 isoform X1 n=1 Tax=Athalia rosae TaxID=37344 RepID=UPI00203370A0|nr:uncharacterized protein LOC125500067 isoform X1 [Athalia rosae]